jgi:hypothetical protein
MFLKTFKKHLKIIYVYYYNNYIMVSNNLYKKFYEELEKKEGITKEQFIKYKFIFCGAFDPPKEIYTNDDGEERTRYIKSRIPNVGDQLFPYRSIDFKNKHPLKYIDEQTFKMIAHKFTFKYECICDHHIICNCFIYSKSQDILLNIGKCCNKRFNDNTTKRFCEICNIEHKNTKNNVCNECRKTLYNKCGKCKKPKELNKYKWCFPCTKGNNLDYIRNIYEYCSVCMIPKITDKDKQYKKCFGCRKI